jgi:hypothetical protein
MITILADTSEGSLINQVVVAIDYYRVCRHAQQTMPCHCVAVHLQSQNRNYTCDTALARLNNRLTRSQQYCHHQGRLLRASWYNLCLLTAVYLLRRRWTRGRQAE